ncbi:DUF4174 domain-containing protein [Tenacibaculum sp. MEBiC06402]|uniref:DUF4174 domain-containing protein n=1 Tax=unclassified Tenacibaculum TaxID=2635139 RepID=UPI003B9A628D
MKSKFIIVLVFLSINVMHSQNLDLSEYKWKNRLVLIITNGNSNLRKQQLNEFQSRLKEFEERKLIFFEIQPKRYRKIPLKIKTKEQDNWFYTAQPYEKHKSKNTDFKVLLIGLDGGIKKQKTNKILTQEQLFTIIDGMPMRRRELKRNN